MIFDTVFILNFLSRNQKKKKNMLCQVFRVKSMSRSSILSFFFSGVTLLMCLFLLYPTRFPYPLIFVTFNCNAKGVTSGACTATLLEHLRSFWPLSVLILFTLMIITFVSSILSYSNLTDKCKMWFQIIVCLSEVSCFIIRCELGVMFQVTCILHLHISYVFGLLDI